MADISISQFKQKVQDFINEHKIDKSGDGYINEINGELAALLSGTGAESVDELLMTDSVQFGNTTKPKKALGVDNAQLEAMENYSKAMEKYTDFGSTEQQTVRDNTRNGLMEKFENLINNDALGPFILDLEELTSSIKDNDILKGLFSNMTNSAVQNLRVKLQNYNEAFKQYDVMYQNAYNTTKETPEGVIITPEGGSYGLDDKLKDAGDKLMQIVDQYIDGSVTQEELQTAINEFSETSVNIGQEIEERTDAILDNYKEELDYNIEVLENDTQTSEGRLALKGGAAMTSFTEAVNNLDNSAVDSPKAEQKEPEVNKYVENGKVIIERDGVKYNINGTRVE